MFFSSSFRYYDKEIRGSFLYLPSFGLHLAVICSACILCYINTLECGFCYDDPAAAINNKDVLPTTPLSQIFLNDFWGTPMFDPRSHGSYRPLCVLTFRWNYFISGFQPKSWHFANTILHMVVCILAYWYLNLLSFTRMSAFLTVFFYAVHPIHTDAVASIVGRAELLSATFFFTALICYDLATKTRGFLKVVLLFISLSCIPLATLCKESGITVAGVIAIHEILVQNKWQPSFSLKKLVNVGMFLRISAVAVVTACFLAVRFQMMPNMPAFQPNINPAAIADTPARQLTYAHLLYVNTKLIIYPSILSSDWTRVSVPFISGFLNKHNLETTIFFAGAISATYLTWRSRPMNCHLAMSLAFIVIPFIPASNLFFPVGFLIAERVLYLPSFGFCALAAIGFTQLFNLLLRKRRSTLNFITLATCLVVILAFAARSVVRNLDWKDNLTLCRSGIRDHPRNAKNYHLIGISYYQSKDYDRSFAYQYKAVRQAAEFLQAHINLALVLRDMNETKFHERALRRHLIFLLHPNFKWDSFYKAEVLTNLVNVLINSNATVTRLSEADELLGMALQMIPNCFSGYLRRGEVWFRLGKFQEARELFKELLDFIPDCDLCLYNSAVVDLTQWPKDNGKVSAALKTLEKTIAMNPDHYYALHTYAAIVLDRELEPFYEQAVGYIQRVIEAEQTLNWKVTAPDIFIRPPETKEKDSMKVAALLTSKLERGKLKLKNNALK